jgi:hypothetical protein
VPIAANVDYQALVADDPDPVFITLPIGQVGVESRNGRTYGLKEVQVIVNTIVNEKSIGQKGHLRDEERGYRFDIPPLVWVGATLEANGTAWGKAYVLKSAPDVREYVKVAKATKAKIGTSIYGTAEIEEGGKVSNLEIESIDIAHPGRLGVPQAAAVPQITQETSQQNHAQEDNPVPTEPVINNTVVHPVVQPAVEPAPAVLVEMERLHKAAIRELEGKNAELKGKADDLAQIVTMLEGAADPINAVRLLNQHVKNLRKENGDLLEESIKAQVAEVVKAPNLRGMIAAMVRDRKPATRNAVTTALQMVMDEDHVKEALKDAVQTTMGPNQNRPLQPQTEGEGQELIHIPAGGSD